MRLVVVAGLFLLYTATAIAGDSQQSAITVRERPPEAIPRGTCKESHSGYVGIASKSGPDITKLTTQQLGEYVAKRLSEGYSITLYPQASGKTFAIATCESVSASLSR